MEFEIPNTSESVENDRVHAGNHEQPSRVCLALRLVAALVLLPLALELESCSDGGSHGSDESRAAASTTPAALHEHSSALALRERGFLSSARILTYWLNPGDVRPAARGTVEQAFADIRDAFDRGDWCAIASYFEGKECGAWELGKFSTIVGLYAGIPAYLDPDSEMGKMFAASREKKRSEVHHMTLVRRPSGEFRLGLFDGDIDEALVFANRNGTWFLGAPAAQVWTIQMIGAVQWMSDAQLLAALEITGRSLRDSTPVPEGDAFRSQLGLLAFQILPCLEVQSAPTAQTTQSIQSPGPRVPAVWSPVGPTKDPYLNAQIQNHIQSMR